MVLARKLEKTRNKSKKTIENQKLVQYYKDRTNPKKSEKEAQNMIKTKTFAGVEREREREPQH